MPDVIQPAMHGRDHCPTGSDPIPCLASVGILSSWEADTTGEFAPDSWQSVSAAGFFNDGYTTPEAAIGVDLDACRLTFPTKTLVRVEAYAQFFGDFDDGDVVAVAITGTWGRVINAVTCDAAGVPGAEKIGVSAAVWHPTTPVDIDLYVFHTNAGNMVLAGCQMTGHMIAPLFTAGWETHA